MARRLAALRDRLVVRRGTEADVAADRHQALSRVTGDRPRAAGTTTSTGGSGTFVGRIAGEDPAEPDQLARKKPEVRP
ncbi:MAG: hypothetical protein GEV07_04060 [Streptosporangiales bacterium]|nr:hypothetical protein [Streptosporangiales bacterium]